MATKTFCDICGEEYDPLKDNHIDFKRDKRETIRLKLMALNTCYEKFMNDTCVCKSCIYKALKKEMGE